MRTSAWPSRTARRVTTVKPLPDGSCATCSAGERIADSMRAQLSSCESVDVRSGQRVQLVTRWADGAGLYVFSEHGTCASLVHQWPRSHASHAVAPDARA